jgi:streptogrisin D
VTTVRSIPRRFAYTAAAALVAGAFLAPPAAQAGPADALSTDAAMAVAGARDAVISGTMTTLEATLGDQTAGSYLDQATGKLMVNVTDAATAESVRVAGAVPRFVTRSGTQLKAATSELQRSASITGTAWWVDPVSNQVVVSADNTVTGANYAQLQKVVTGLGGTARMERDAGTLKPLVTGGDAITTGGARCSLGFNVLVGNTAMFLTAGHCTNIGASWSGGGQALGNRFGTSFPGNDYGIVQYNANVTNRPGHVNLYNGTDRDIANAGNAFVGQAVQRSGSTTGLRGGTVNAVNATVTYPQGQVTGLIRTNVCAEPGDSGGSLFANNTALGMTSGGSGNCTAGGTTFFQPVTEALAVFGARVY